MKRIVNLLKDLLSRWQGAFSGKQADVDTLMSLVPQEILGYNHSCAPVALTKVIPDLDPSLVIEAFSYCCNKWPYGGVTNKEFNITLRYLKILDRFEYATIDGMTVQDFLVQYPNATLILLIHGHFTVIKGGKIRDSIFFQTPTEHVYCSWRLIEN